MNTYYKYYSFYIMFTIFLDMSLYPLIESNAGNQEDCYISREKPKWWDLK